MPREDLGSLPPHPRLWPGQKASKMSFLAQSSHEDWLSDWRAGSKVSRKDVLWLMMNLVFFVREGTEEADHLIFSSEGTQLP